METFPGLRVRVETTPTAPNPAYAYTLLPYIEQDPVRSLGGFSWLVHRDRQVISPIEQLQVRGFSGNESILYIATFQAPGDYSFSYYPTRSSIQLRSTLPASSDSVWIELGYPVQTTPDGRNFKPLFAFRVEDLDNRVNVKVHEAVDTLFAGGTRVAVGDVNADGTTDVLAVWNPWDINPGSTPPGVWSLIPPGVTEPVLPTSQRLSTDVVDAVFADIGTLTSYPVIVEVRNAAAVGAMPQPDPFTPFTRTGDANPDQMVDDDFFDPKEHRRAELLRLEALRQLRAGARFVRHPGRAELLRLEALRLLPPLLDRGHIPMGPHVA